MFTVGDFLSKTDLEQKDYCDTQVVVYKTLDKIKGDVELMLDTAVESKSSLNDYVRIRNCEVDSVGCSNNTIYVTISN